MSACEIEHLYGGWRVFLKFSCAVMPMMRGYKILPLLGGQGGCCIFRARSQSLEPLTVHRKLEILSAPASEGRVSIRIAMFSHVMIYEKLAIS